MDLLFTIQNLCAIQISIFKCLCRKTRDWANKSVSAVESRALRFYSMEQMRYFNISVQDALRIGRSRRFEQDLINSGDVEYLNAAYQQGWKYKYNTISSMIDRYDILPVNMITALRNIGCFWGCETMSMLIARRKNSSVYDLMNFAITDGHTILVDHILLAIGTGDITTIRIICAGAGFPSLWNTDKSSMRATFGLVILHETDELKKQELVDFWNVLKIAWNIQDD